MRKNSLPHSVSSPPRVKYLYNSNIMKTIGQILKNARVEKKLSINDLEDVTKIKTSFLRSIENEDWASLPAFPVVLGFVKSISGVLLLDENTTVAVLKRDYPPKKLTINPRPDISDKKMVWGPKTTFFAGIFLIVVAVAGYLGYQYYKFISPPVIRLESPKENQVVAGNSVLVFGSTDTDAKITVNNQPVLVDEKGKFKVELGVGKATFEVVVKAISRTGKESVVSRKINLSQN